MTKPERPELDHPCKETCSGWRQGFERGKAALDEALRELADLKFELEAKQRPLSEQVLALTVERDALKAEVERLRWSARNHTAYPSAMCYAESLEAELTLERECNAVLREGLKKCAVYPLPAPGPEGNEAWQALAREAEIRGKK